MKGHLRNAQIAYIRVGVLLAQVRDERLYARPQAPGYGARAVGLVAWCSAARCAAAPHAVRRYNAGQADVS